jgi:hypothetical protein
LEVLLYAVDSAVCQSFGEGQEQERLAAAKLETFGINGLMEAASEQAVGTKMGTEARIN